MGDMAREIFFNISHFSKLSSQEVIVSPSKITSVALSRSTSWT